MSTKEKIVHRQQFQNSQQTVEVIIKAKPKEKISLKSKPKLGQPPFVRDCILKKEIENLAVKEIDKKSCVTNVEKPKTKCSYPTTNIQIYKKSRKKRKEKPHNVLPPNMTWRELLENHSLSNISEGQTSHSTDDPSSSVLDSDRETNNNLRKLNARQPSQESLQSKTKVPNTSIPSANNACTQYQKEKTTQILPQIPPRNVSEIQQNFQHTRFQPTSLSTKPYHNKGLSSDQTHSPFGESALRLLHQLRERLQSQGDREGSNIVSAIEAYFGTGQTQLLDAPDGGISQSPAFPSVFETPHPQNRGDVSRANRQQNEELKRVVATQESELREREETIRELKALSQRLIEYHEQLKRELNGERKGVSCGSGLESRGGPDSGVEMSSSSGELQRALQQVTCERDALCNEVRSQREVILNLEVELSEMSKKEKVDAKKGRTAAVEHIRNARKEREERSEDVLSSFPLSLHSLPPTSLPLSPLPLSPRPLSPRLLSPRSLSPRPLPTQLISHTETDAPFKETQNGNSPSKPPLSSSSSSLHTGDEGRARNDPLKPLGTSSPQGETEPPPGSTPRPALTELGAFVSRKGNPAPHSSDAPSRGGRAQLSAYERVVTGGERLVVPPTEMCFSFMSDVSAENQESRNQGSVQCRSGEEGEGSVHQGSMQSRCKEGKYLESTRMSENLKSSSLSPSKARSRNRRFDVQLSALQSDSS